LWFWGDAEKGLKILMSANAKQFNLILQEWLYCEKLIATLNHVSRINGSKNAFD